MTTTSAANRLSFHDPLISVVVATRNATHKISRYIDSIVGQDYGDGEIAVSDGNPTGGTIDRVKKYTENQRIMWQSGSDTGIAQTWNRTLGIARGDWILFLDSDDRLHDNHMFARIVPFVL